MFDSIKKSKFVIWYKLHRQTSHVEKIVQANLSYSWSKLVNLLYGKSYMGKLVKEK